MQFGEMLLSTVIGFVVGFPVSVFWAPRAKARI